MKTKYSIAPTGDQFTVTDPQGERVGIYDTLEAAQSAVDQNRKQDIIWETAKLLFDISVKTLAETRSLDRETAIKVMRDASAVVD